MTALAVNDSTPVHGVDGVNLSVSDAPANTSTGYDTDEYPASPAILYYISIEKTGSDSLVSERFTPDVEDGAHLWPAVVIPSAGSWTAHLRLDATDASVANVAITAS